MAAPHNARPLDRRSALRLGIVNGVLWALGNGLTTGAVITYFALELGAAGRQLGAILALQSVVGIFRFAAPPLIVRMRGAKNTAIVLFAASYLLLGALPLVVLESFPAEDRLPFFIALLAVHQLLESLATVALWAWLGQLVPPRIRGRYFAARQRWQLAALIPILTAVGVFMDRWRKPARQYDTLEAAIWGYAVVVAIGAALLLLSIVPLLWMPRTNALDTIRPARRWPGLAGFAPLSDRRFLRLLLFGCWLSFFNGLPQTAANIFPYRILGLGLLPMLLLPVGMRCGQIAASGWVGRFSDRYGNRPVMLLSQAAVALGPLFYLLATPEQPWWLAGAFALWSAYAGLNICLPNLTLKLARDGNYAAYAAAYFALTGVAYGVSTFVGGWLFDEFVFDTFFVGPFQFDRYRYFFYIGCVTRLLGLLFILGIDEPGARTWRQILRGRPAERARAAISA